MNHDLERLAKDDCLAGPEQERLRIESFAWQARQHCTLDMSDLMGYI